MLTNVYAEDKPIIPLDNTNLIAQNKQAIALGGGDLVAEDKHQAIIQEILYYLENRLYQTREVNDAFAKDVYTQLVSNLDPQKIYLTKADHELYSHLTIQLDNDLSKGNLDNLVAFYNLVRQRQMLLFRTFIDWLEFGVDKVDLTVDETLGIDSKKRLIVKHPKHLPERWRKFYKNELILGKLNNETDKQIQTRLIKRYTNRLKRLNQTNSQDMFDTIAGIITSVTGPHTSYFSPRRVEDFNIDLSLSLEGIGAVLSQDADHTVVNRIVPGSPAEKGGELATNDYIIGVGQTADDIIDIVGIRLDEVVDKIRGPKGTDVFLQIISNGNLKNPPTIIKITRNKIKLEDQAASSEVITTQSDDGEQIKMGVITLPTFYFDFAAFKEGNKDFKSTTRDVLKLIQELKKETDLYGIIVDLRNNGGGALTEASQLTGLFLDSGPVVQVKKSNGDITAYLDRYEGFAYTGPVAVLINRRSASASEIFAGAIQDYQRGLIVGSRSYGKGTVQTLENISEGQIKFTQSKFYRVSGKSTQNIGVDPDITIPDTIDPTQIGESNLDFAMLSGSVAKLKHPQYLNISSLTPEIQTSVNNRIPDDPYLSYVTKLNQYRKNDVEATISLNLEKRQQERKKDETWQLNAINDLRQQQDQEPIVNLDDHEFDYENAQDDPYIKATAKALLDWLTLHQS